MFTGIVEELGEVIRLERGAAHFRLHLRAPTLTRGLELGDSIAVNGVCLTASGLSRDSFVADVMPETLRNTNLGGLKPGDGVNLERSLRLGDRLGGHLVTGHVDGVAHIAGTAREGNALVIHVKPPAHLLRHIVLKGSVALDGVSLTVAGLSAGGFSVSLIPHTRGVTTLGSKRRGDKVNIETDIIAKYIERFTSPEKGGITEETLRRNGFII